MTDEERQRQMDFILNQQAQFATNMQRLEEADERARQEDQKATKRFDRLERVMKMVVRAGLRERKDTRQKIAALVDSHIKLAESQAHTDKRLDALIDIVREGREGKT